MCSVIRNKSWQQSAPSTCLAPVRRDSGRAIPAALERRGLAREHYSTFVFRGNMCPTKKNERKEKNNHNSNAVERFLCTGEQVS